MLFPHCLADIVTTATSVPATQPAWNLAIVLVNLSILAWAILAVLALLKLRVFWSGSFRKSPARTASMLPVLFIGAFLLYVVLVQVALGVGASSGWIPELAKQAPAAATSAHATTEDVELPAPLTPQQDFRLQTLNAGAELLAVLIALSLVPFLFQGGFRGLGLHPFDLPRGILLGILGFMIVYPLLLAEGGILESIYEHFGHQMTTHQTLQEMEQTTNTFIKLGDCVIAGLVAPFVEEIFFRGILQTALIQRPGSSFAMLTARVTGNPVAAYRPPAFQRWLAILVTAALFAAAHLAPDQFPILFLLAIGLGYLYERTGNLFACITLHALFNCITLIQVYFAT